MIWLALWVIAILAIYWYFSMDRFTSPFEAILMTIFFGGFVAGFFVFLLPHMIVPLISSDPVYDRTVTLQEVNDHYVTKNAEGYVIVYGDEYNYYSVQLDSTPPAPEEGCEKPEAKVYSMQNTNPLLSIIPMVHANRYIICVPDGGIKE